MPLLTFENLDLNSLPYYDYQTISRGRAYYTGQMVTIANFTGPTATCNVQGDQDNYTVTLIGETKVRVKTSCTCPQVQKGRVCKHIVAAMLTVREYIQYQAINQWQYRLSLALESNPKRKVPRERRNKYAVIFGMQTERSNGGQLYYRMVPYAIKSQDWQGIKDLENIPNLQDQGTFLDTNRSWVHFAEVISRSLDERGVVNIPREGVQLIGLMTRLGNFYYGQSDFATYLPLIAKMEIPVFLMSSRTTFKQRLHVLSAPVKIEAALAHEGPDYSLHAGLSLNGKVFTTIKSSLQILSNQPAWMLAGDYIVPLENPEAVNLMNFFPMTIPAEDEREFRENYLHPIADLIPIQGDVVSYIDVAGDPIPRLYLRDEGRSIRAELRFNYGEHEVVAKLNPELRTTLDIPDSWGLVRVQRNGDQEAHFSQLLTDARYGLKRSSNSLQNLTYELRSRTHPFDFLLHSIPLLTRAGFEIYGDENLKVGKINRSTPSISLSISSGLDWFDVAAVVHYGDQEVSLQEVHRALQKKERFVKLADGSIGQIPEQWLERYKKLFALGEETKTGLRVRDFHLSLVDTLLADASESQVAAEYQLHRDLLRGFDHIQPQPVPKNFNGELRPYQKAGLDWLHFLHDYGFGGCLADDMGLGKTIQVLAFLQSLAEQGKMTAASLLVVPKSLIANWLREAERFTPGLRLLEFTGITRNKETAQFGQFDIILTTYGTMLRDIEFLRSYRFLYAILDESQNIKNPLAQSSKATRLLNAQHRLVMTGTPVENNVFELWSQFTFLNPGLLGSMDFFKHEFAGPIEKRESEETPRILRRLVYPFILRRTKEQVAPELPLRTERILYTDLEPAQRKLYLKTRDYYRDLLVGKIEAEGINEVRMKILEGLLRLRQICIHPLLVDAAYRGESAKFEVLFETIEDLLAEGHKALIFSQFVQTLSLVRKELDARKIRYAYLDGQTNDRQSQVDLFQTNPDIPLFLISLKAGGVGLNLTAADYVIHIDPWWNPAVEMQAADRAHRIGQEKPVFIYKLIARDSVEEKILLLQEQKKELVDQIISAEGSFFKSISKEDVQVLFS